MFHVFPNKPDSKLEVSAKHLYFLRGSRGELYFWTSLI